MKNHHLALLFVLFVTACSTGEPGTPPLADYNGLSKINLDVAGINIVDRSSGTAAKSEIFQPTIEEAVRRWADSRFRAVGTTGQAVVVIKNADIQTLNMPLGVGIDDWFTRQQAAKYNGHVEVEVEARGVEGYGVAHAEATRYVTVPEHPSDAERRKAYNAMLGGLMADLNENLDQNIQQHMQDFIVTAPLATEAPPVMIPPESPGQSP